MEYNLSDAAKIQEVVSVNAYPQIRLVKNGVCLIPFNQLSKDKLDHLNSKIFGLLNSATTEPGVYTLEGRHNGTRMKNAVQICSIKKGTISEVAPVQFQPAQPAGPVASKTLTEWAEYKAKNEYQAQEIARLTAELEAANKKIEDLESELEDETETKNSMLAENSSAVAIKEMVMPFVPLAAQVLENLSKKWGLLPNDQGQPGPIMPQNMGQFQPPAGGFGSDQNPVFVVRNPPVTSEN